MDQRTGSTVATGPKRVRCARWWVLVVSAVSCASVSAPARADELTLVPADDAVFRYTQPQRVNHVRATLEVTALLGLGFAQYVDNHDFNSQDWDFSYDWGGLREKLSSAGYSFDTNGFDTNFITHPAAGVLYYWAARSNRMSPFAAFAYAFVASTLWEYFGELRERASVNDLLATPLAGFVLGESTIQLGAFFDRSCDSLPNRVLGSVLDPFKAVHDALDGARPLRALSCDRNGLAQYGEHELRLSLAAGSRFTLAGPNSATRLETQLTLHTHMVALEDYGRAGTGFTTFSDSDISEFWLHGAWAGTHWTDLTIRAAIVPVGLHFRSIQGGRGHEVTLGLLLGTEYNVHRFGAAAEGTLQRDRYFALDAPGVMLNYRQMFRSLRIEVELQTSVALAGSDALALPEFLTAHAIDELPTIVRRNGYNYAAGLRFGPRAKLAASWFAAGAELALTQLWVITALDRIPEQTSAVSGSERRTGTNAWIEASIPGWPLRFALNAAMYLRSGELAEARASRTELRIFASVAAVL